MANKKTKTDNSQKRKVKEKFVILIKKMKVYINHGKNKKVIRNQT